uniref:GNAT family N-acetyltransferase n=1 Tax=Azospirillum argentinense TaxID=2970906 RepID=UPI001FFF33E6
MEDLYVTPEARRYGVGRKLLATVAKLANERGLPPCRPECAALEPGARFLSAHRLQTDGGVASLPSHRRCDRGTGRAGG